MQTNIMPQLTLQATPRTTFSVTAVQKVKLIDYTLKEFHAFPPPENGHNLAGILPSNRIKTIPL